MKGFGSGQRGGDGAALKCSTTNRRCTESKQGILTQSGYNNDDNDDNSNNKYMLPTKSKTLKTGKLKPEE